MRTTVYLTGFMGAGKSAVGKELARLLRRPFVDLDAFVEREAGSNVASIFARRGEAAFRKLESKALARTAKRKGVIVALGGGTLLDARNRALVARTGLLVGLSCSRAELVRRLRPSRATRPLLAGGALSARVGQLLTARRAAYEGTDLSVSTTANSPAAAAGIIARRLP
ncbi:MAG: shikimate kinase [Elusimicrobia bacterium]|nr:shikimate kinase [Elusimicrobiota bacterium]